MTAFTSSRARIIGLVGTSVLLLAPAHAQRAVLSRADSQLVMRILTAEDHRDSTGMVFHEAASSADTRIRELGRRALARVKDPKFGERGTFAPVKPSVIFPEPAWRLRFRALTAARTNCTLLRDALADSTWAVRLRAADLVPAPCAADSALVRTLVQWASAPAPNERRQHDDVSWQAAAHALVAVARVSPADARTLVARHAESHIPSMRIYAARAAAALADTATLKRLARDHDDNVKEAAIEALAKLAGHSADDEYIATLDAKGYQAVRAAARALAKSPRGDEVLRASLSAARRLRRDSSEASRDTRVALLDRIGELATAARAKDVADLARDFDCDIVKRASDIVARLAPTGQATPKCTPFQFSLAREAVALALGRDVRVRVSLADSSGGGSFVIRLRGDVAPIMAGRVLALLRKGYYNGRVWHRVEPDFVVQGGGMGANEYLGNPRFMRDELGLLSHTRGTIGMSTRGHDTGDGQSFFNLRDNARLDPLYTVFAEVIEGMDVVDGMLEGDVIAQMRVVD